jgi:HAD superfamily hydrolase (TIGR01549 family)
MPLTLLIDLDDTLLLNPVNTFMPAYLNLLSRHLSPYVDPAKMVPQLLRSTDKMIANEDPNLFLEEIFDADFYPSLGLEKNTLKPYIEEFYSSTFQTLQGITEPVEGARDLLEFANKNEYKIVIATNPLFPQIAITSRLNWAGFPVEEFNFDLITSYESMHFAKPNPSYYKEILDLLKWPTQVTCMVGNSLVEDIIPASKYGFPGYLITDKPHALPADCNPLSSFGGFAGIIPWLNSLDNKKS